ncbi:WecB/TagA/CpsF family glycosyltransferase [Carnobacterium divergens]|uniref:WecB/TagA/CpsF family glycosyltransferase n=1 Tax=Carnobacterium divergens TaxID=2748 RepID=A0AAW8RD13_CARDV|nr:WecB/TagA/CpsF family glycosyltransferase [Carnobacterium divergens]MDO0874238.1 WecB/TagA/CpsF family glycosyltransferase [Carnobacterium divergens]MDT1959386.1 WecB/TagA/CpsF family glycosyltransferase [Carnobacterium divergens]MDT1975353.1 WecB/TagA/CpsF family glycosyltransferase [Carnobacterium divergens]SUX21098.1 Putative N-acetylmannosaminyltransferase [Carnobacterium divergens]
MRVKFLNCYVDDVGLMDSIMKIEGIIKRKKPSQHIVIYPSKINSMQKDLSLRLIVNKSPLITTDSSTILHASKLLKRPLKQRISTKLLFIELLKKCEEQGYRPYFLGSSNEVLEDVVNYVRITYPTLDISGYHNGYFSKKDTLKVVKEIQKSQSDILFVAFSSPKKEYWIDEYLGQLGIPFAMGVGANFDVLADEIKTKPIRRLSKKIRKLLVHSLFGNAFLLVHTLKARVKSLSQ